MNDKEIIPKPNTVFLLTTWNVGGWACWGIYSTREKAEIAKAGPGPGPNFEIEEWTVDNEEATQ